MDNSNVALITKLVLEAVEKQKSSDDAGYLVSILHRNTLKCCSAKAIS